MPAVIPVGSQRRRQKILSEAVGSPTSLSSRFAGVRIEEQAVFTPVVEIEQLAD